MDHLQPQSLLAPRRVSLILGCISLLVYRIVVGNVVFLDNVGFGQDLQGFDAIVDDVVYGLSE